MTDSKYQTQVVTPTQICKKVPKLKFVHHNSYLQYGDCTDLRGHTKPKMAITYKKIFVRFFYKNIDDKKNIQVWNTLNIKMREKKAISKFWRSVRCITFLSREIYPKHSQLWQIQRAPYNTNKAQQSWHIRFPNPSYRLYFTQVNKITHRRILVINTPMKILMPHCTRARKKTRPLGLRPPTRY